MTTDLLRAAASMASSVAVLASLSAPVMAQDSAAKPAPASKSAKAPSAKAAAKAGAEEAAVLAQLRKLYPATKFGTVTKTPIRGVFEVVMGPNIAYVGPEGTHFLFGHMYDMQRQVDLTAEREAGVPGGAEAVDSAQGAPGATINVSELPLGDAIKRVNGTGARVLVVFADPLCPYCKRLEASLPELADTTIYTFLVPILGEGSRKAAEELWAQAMPERASDLAVIDRNLRLASRFSVRATPTLVRADGQVEAGAKDVADLDRWLGPAASKTAQLDSPLK